MAAFNAALRLVVVDAVIVIVEMSGVCKSREAVVSALRLGMNRHEGAPLGARNLLELSSITMVDLSDTIIKISDSIILRC